MGKIERGETDPGLEVLERVARGLRTTLSDLLRIAEGEAADASAQTGEGAEWNPPRESPRRSPRLVAENRKQPKKKK